MPSFRSPPEKLTSEASIRTSSITAPDPTIAGGVTTGGVTAVFSQKGSVHATRLLQASTTRSIFLRDIDSLINVAKILFEEMLFIYSLIRL